MISGDNPATVSAIALQAGVVNADNYIDASTIKTDEVIDSLGFSMFRSNKIIKDGNPSMNISSNVI